MSAFWSPVWSKSRGAQKRVFSRRRVRGRIRGTGRKGRERRNEARTRESKGSSDEEVQATSREAAARHRLFLREMLFSLTEGRLHLCETEADLPRPLSPAPIDNPVELAHRSIQVLRQQVERGTQAIGMPSE